MTKPTKPNKREMEIAERTTDTLGYKYYIPKDEVSIDIAQIAQALADYRMEISKVFRQAPDCGCKDCWYAINSAKTIEEYGNE